MSKKKKIPVTEERCKELNKLKKSGQTYDELLEKLINEYNRKELADKARQIRRSDKEELRQLEDV